MNREEYFLYQSKSFVKGYHIKDQEFTKIIILKKNKTTIKK